MSIIDFPAMLLATAFCFLIYLFVQRRSMGMTYGDARHGIWSAIVRASLQRLQRAEYHPINWRPNLIILGGNPDKRGYLLELGSAVVQDRGLVTYFHLLEGLVSTKAPRRLELVSDLRSRFELEHPNVFYRADVVDDIYRGGVSVAQSYGLGTFEPNTLMLGWPTGKERPEGYVQMLRDLVALDKSVLAVHYNPEKGYGDRKRIHIWWGGFKGNGGMMLLLAYLVTAQRKWRKAEVTLLTVVEAESDRQERERALNQILDNARLEATSRVLVRNMRSIGDLMEEESGDADLLILGMRIPEAEESALGFIEQKQQLLANLPTTVLVQSARNFVGEPVLFDTGSDQTDDQEGGSDEP
jgi:hypothetical protein